MFNEVINDIGHRVVLNKENALEFANDGVFLLIFIRYWREDNLCRVFLKPTGRTNRGQLDLSRDGRFVH